MKSSSVCPQAIPRDVHYDSHKNLCLVRSSSPICLSIIQSHFSFSINPVPSCQSVPQSHLICQSVPQSHLSVGTPVLDISRYSCPICQSVLQSHLLVGTPLSDVSRYSSSIRQSVLQSHMSVCTPVQLVSRYSSPIC